MVWCDVVAGGVRIHVRVTPKSSREGIEGIETDAAGARRLKVRVNALPAEGEANARVIALLAKALGVPASAFEITGGAHHRNKTLTVAGARETLMAKLTKLAEGT